MTALAPDRRQRLGKTGEGSAGTADASEASLHPASDEPDASAASHQSRLDDRVAAADCTRLDDLGVDPAQPQLFARADVHEPQRHRTEPGRELRAAGVGLVGDLDDGRADRQPRAGGQVLMAEIEVDMQLITGEGPIVVGVAGDEAGQSGVDDVQLHVRVRGTVSRPPARPLVPGIADEALGERQLGLVEHLAPVDRRAAHDEVERAVILRRREDLG